MGAYYALAPFDSITLEVGPAFKYSAEGYTDTTTSDKHSIAFWVVELNARILAMLTKNLGVFATFGVFYSSGDNKNSTASTDTLTTTFALESLSLGLAYYFK